MELQSQMLSLLINVDLEGVHIKFPTTINSLNLPFSLQRLCLGNKTINCFMFSMLIYAKILSKDCKPKAIFVCYGPPFSLVIFIVVIVIF